MSPVKAGTFHPKSSCERCGVEMYLEELQLLPEVEAFARANSSYLRGSGVKPESPSEFFLLQKYGYKSDCLFCPDCLEKLINR